MCNQPLISVVMATFNEPPVFIIQAVQSILNQTLSDFELLLIDDSTNTDTITAIDALIRSDSRIRLIRGKERFGFVKALNIGLRQARGKYIARMDGDDISLPNRFELQVDFLKKNPDISVVGGFIDIINKGGKVTSHRNYATSFSKVILFALVRNPLLHPTVMFRKEVLEKGFYYDETFLKAEDLELWLRLINNGYKISNVPDTVLSYRVDGNFVYKRVGENFAYNYKARKKNFSWRIPFWSLVSILISKIYTILPKRVINIVYRKENGL
jgi:glycosyltransferase involved in cell wall biosynthesis